MCTRMPGPCDRGAPHPVYQCCIRLAAPAPSHTHTLTPTPPYTLTHSHSHTLNAWVLGVGVYLAAAACHHTAPPGGDLWRETHSDSGNGPFPVDHAQWNLTHSISLWVNAFKCGGLKFYHLSPILQLCGLPLKQCVEFDIY